MGRRYAERDTRNVPHDVGTCCCIVSFSSRAATDVPHFKHAELYDILYDAATEFGAQVRYNAEVADIDTEEHEVTLASGETLSADVLVGADGEYGPSRTALLGKQDTGTPTGLAVYE